MEEVILIKLGEVILKGLNRRNFEDALVKTIKKRIKEFGLFEIKNIQSTIYLVPKSDRINLSAVSDKIGKIFGIAAYCKACFANKNMPDICEKTALYLEKHLNKASSFKVESKRSDKKFSLKSPEISREVGSFLLDKYPNLVVNVHKPDLTINVEVRDLGAYVYGSVYRGAGGMPVGTGGNAAILISGGIDSSVAAWMMAKRGISLMAIHFASQPYTSPRAEYKVKRLLAKVAQYSGWIPMYTVPFTKIQEEIQKKCKEDFFTIIMRRLMMQISEKIAINNGSQALITGESLGQVASQTISAIACTEDAVNMPVFRPLIGMDKNEIINISRKIDTFDISIEPYEDCCTVFTPKHPRTRPLLKYVLQEQEKINWDCLTEEAVQAAERTLIK